MCKTKQAFNTLSIITITSYLLRQNDQIHNDLFWPLVLNQILYYHSRFTLVPRKTPLQNRA